MAPLAHTLALLAMSVATVAIKVVPLDMARNSFDDQYQGCSRAMAATWPALLRSEFQQDPLFEQVWSEAVAEWRKQGSRVSPLLSPTQAIAIMAYSSCDVYTDFIAAVHMAYSSCYVYRHFNTAVRKAGRSPQEYRDNFHYKTFHFLLTQALGTLREAQNSQCLDVFQGVRDIRFDTRPGQKVRFGQFTSTLLSKEIARRYGTDTIFQVHTCHGVDILNFSYYPSSLEVLIPPYETFEVTEVTQEGNKTQIQLRSTGTYSKYNCEWLRGESVSMAHFHLGGLLLATTALAVAAGIL